MTPRPPRRDRRSRPTRLQSRHRWRGIACRVLQLLGSGGMGAVYLAEHRRMERHVALKVMSPNLDEMAPNGRTFPSRS